MNICAYTYLLPPFIAITSQTFGTNNSWFSRQTKSCYIKLLSKIQYLPSFNFAVNVMGINPVTSKHFIVFITILYNCIRFCRLSMISRCIFLQPWYCRTCTDLSPFKCGYITGQVTVQDVLLVSIQFVTSDINIWLTSRVIMRQINAHFQLCLKKN